MSGQDRGRLSLQDQAQIVDSQHFKVLRFLKNFLKLLGIRVRPFTLSNLDLKVSSLW
jgi:hypothetical protein